ncbi:MAG: nicotinate-nucleotide adenylyltransferase [Planctomycetota bacterium]
MNGERRRWGLLGGSFDPIHVGHIKLAEAALTRLDLDRVLLVPAAQAPHKAGAVAAFADRVAMARVAAAAHPVLTVWEGEGERSGPSYTVDTVTQLMDEHPGVAWDLLVGADMLADLPGWHRAAELAGLVRIVAFARPGQDFDAAWRVCHEGLPGVDAVRLEIPTILASSSEIRRRLALGEAVSDLLDPSVLSHIESAGLYVGKTHGNQG